MSTKLNSRGRKKHENHDLELTTFLNLLVVLISFLLVTSVFSRIAIQELKLPTAAGAGGAIDAPPLVTVEVVLRKGAVEVEVSSNGKSAIVASVPRVGEKYDIQKLSEQLQGQKSLHPEVTDATLLVEPDIAYEDVIHVMDTVKMARVQVPGQESVQKIPLFPNVSLGDAP